MPLGGDSEEKEEYTGRDSPWGVSVSEPYIGCPSPGVQAREDKVPWLVRQLFGLTGELQDTPGFHSQGVPKCWLAS